MVGSLLSLEARVGIAFAGWTFPFNSNLNTRAAVCALFTDGLKNIPRIKALGTNPTNDSSVGSENPSFPTLKICPCPSASSHMGMRTARVKAMQRAVDTKSTTRQTLLY